MIPGDVKDIHVVEEPEEVVGQVIEKTEMKTDITFPGMEVLGLVAVLLVLGLTYDSGTRNGNHADRHSI